ncbi:MAG: tetratricopeptide repeat protein, partial [Treponema sp.]|nr:tetratricopeptide repeat protein [Treponema sp.]
MPGLSQLKQFNKDLLAIGDEVTIRASRGEKPVEVHIPKEVEDKNDSEDFVLGMPEIEAEVDNSPVDEDLSDLAGLANPASTSSNNSTEPSPTFEAPDLSDLLNPIAVSDEGGSGSSSDMPDLSMFEDAPVEEEEEVVEEEPEEISVADMGLDALLSGAGFDAPEEESEPDVEEEPLQEKDFKEISDLDSDIEDISEMDEAEEIPAADDGLSELERDLLASEGNNPSSSSSKSESSKTNPGEPSLEDLLGNLEFDTPADSSSDGGNVSEKSAEDIPSLDEDLGGTLDESLPADDIPSLDEDIPSLDEDIPSLDDNIPSLDESPLDAPADDIPSLDDEFGLDTLTASDESSAPAEESPAPDMADDIPSLDESPLDAPAEDIPSLDEDLGGALDEALPAEAMPSLDESPLDAPADDIPSLDDSSLEAPADDTGAGAEGLDDFSTEGMNEFSTEGMEDFSTDGLDDLGLDTLTASDESSAPAEESPAPDMADDMPSLDESPLEAPADDIPSLDDDLGGALDEALPAEDMPSLDESPLDAPADDIPSLDESSLDAPADDIPSLDESSLEAPADDTGAGAEGLDDFSTEGMDEFSTDGMEDFSTDGLDNMDFGSDQAVEAIPAEKSDGGEESPAPESSDADLGDMGTPADLFNMDDIDFGSSDATAPVDFNAEDDIPDYGDIDGLDSSSEDEGSEDFDENQPLETFDTSEMEGMDFGIPDTDTQLNGGAGDFELGNNDDFAMEGEFEIPGFSDVTTAKEEKKSKTNLASSKDAKGKKGKKGLDEPDFNEAEEAENLPPNTLSDSQYKKFLKNLSEYPLNVRLAFEDLIVQDEFTDDAEFEVIEKILNKAPARQVASMLEKMLDTSIPVPRDFEHRTAEEYEAYKKSLSYQLRNKIIPGLIVGVAVLLVGWGIFNFSKNCIYKPLKANKLYKQGYALLQADEYPQSEMRFEEAVSYRINKKWFFNYARGYREHKQYQRAGAMYQRILNYFKHDKAAGLEYADMELNDLANYEKAEEIVRRQVLDYHINDADGILKLGDIFLEWGTEKDPAKLENAREQYATLIQLYKANDLYLSRMMRYFIRTDNLRNVIQMQKTFEPREKSLCSDDWAELSGYLLDKYYGPLAPSEEYLRYEIEGLRGLLLRAVKTGPSNPIAYYNLAKYFINSGENGSVENTLQNAIECFNTVPSMKKRDIYKYIDSYRLLGEHYIETTDYLQAQEQFAEGISLYTTERDNAGFEGTPEIGKLYEDMANIKYSVSGDYDEALQNYKYSVELENDSPSIRYRIGYIQYKNKNYAEALGSFMKSGDGNVKERNLLLAMANTLSLRGDDYAAQGYYNQLIDNLDSEIAKRGMVFPQASVKDY